ncbi:MAG TPA: collagen-binding domain-containing protein [Candidatus Angelobacter sp.]|nr:collagen-binding domain-containing protein [Candidatus Angelobacter sp.]
MNMKISPQKSNQGTALLVTMIFVLTFAAALAGYLLMIDNSDQMVARSQNWNSSLALAESGVEESLAQLNSGVNFSANGWSQSGSNYLMSRALNGATYSVGVQSGLPTSTIYSTGIVTVPLTGALVTRVVKVIAQQSPLFNVGLGAVGGITMNGNSVGSDSWNSYDPNQSTNGLYDNYSGTNGSVASEDGVVNIGNHTIQGNLYLGPTASYSGAQAQVTGTVYSDYNVTFPSASLPTITPNGQAVTWSAAPTTNSPVTEHNLTTPGYYIITDNTPIEVQPGVTVTLDVRSLNFDPSSVTIDGGTANSGTIIMYQESGSVTLGGNSSGGAIGNRPENFYYFGLPGVTSITLGGNSQFVGAIYAPNASLTLNGGGGNNGLQGAAIVASVTLNGHYDFHYDTALATNQFSRGAIPVSWQEL